MMRLLRRVWYLLNSRRLERELAEELALHRELTGDARAFGSGALAQNRARDVWIWPWLQDIAQDVRFAARLLAKDRRFTFAAVVALAFGIAATNTVFTFVDAALFKDLPFDHPQQLMAIGTRDPRGRDAGASYQDFRDWQAASTTVADMAATTQSAFTIADDDRAAERLRGAHISWNTFRILRVTPLIGRGLRADDDRPGAPPVVVLGEGVWRGRYQSDSAVIGATVRINDIPSVVVGVMRERFAFPGTAEAWAPLAVMDGLTTASRGARTLNVVARLRDGVTAAQARSEMTAIADRLAREHPDTNRGITTAVAPPFEALRRSTAPPLEVLLAAVVFVLLVACANVATLLLGRAAQRSREIAIRSSLGASRWRIVRQLLIESLMLAFIGGAGGLLLSLYGVRYFGVAFDAREVASPERLATPYWVDLSPDARILAFVAAVCVGSALLFGLVPALHVSKTDANDTLKDASRGAAGSARASRWSSALMVLELALTVVLLAGAAMPLRSFLAMYQRDLVIDTAGLVTARLALPPKNYPTVASRNAFLERLERGLQPIAGVAGATLASDGLFGTMGGGTIRPVAVEGRVDPAGEAPPNAQYVYVGRDYLGTIGLPLQEGRAFLPSDDGPGQPGAVVNRAFADTFFPGVSPLGRRIRRAAAPTATPTVPAAPDGPWLTIVGVVPTLPQFGPRQLNVEPTVYAPARAEPEPGRFVSLIARGTDARATAAFLREHARAIDPGLALYAVMAVDAGLADSRWGGRLIAALFGSIAVIALTLSSVGLFAVTAHAVAQRTQEIGVRMALGAQIAEVVWLFVRRTCVQLTIGVAFGVAGALATGRVLRAVLETEAGDAWELTAVVTMVTFIAIAASAIPARRAARVDPVVALRHE